jgi:hypothetical protein
MSNSKGDGLVLVCIDLSEPAETARRYFAEQKLPFTNLLDPNKETFNKYGAGGIPKIVLIDRDGSVRYFQQGRRSGQDFHAGVAKLGLGFRIRRRLTGSLTCRTRIWLSTRFAGRFGPRDRDLGCFRATRTRRAIKRR